MNRRGFLGSILALAAAPAIVRADSLMRIVPREMDVFTIEGVTGFDGSLERFYITEIWRPDWPVQIIQQIYEEGRTIKIRVPNAYTRLRA